MDLNRTFLVGRNKFAEMGRKRDAEMEKWKRVVDTGVMQFNGGAYEAAIKSINIGLGKGVEPTGELYYVLARACVQLYRKTSLVEHLESANQYFQKCMAYPQYAVDVEVITQVADAHVKYGSYETALLLLGNTISGYPSHPQLNRVVYISAQVMKQVKNFNQSGAYFQYILEEPPSPWTTNDIMIAIARVYDQDGSKESLSLAKDAWKSVYTFKRSNDPTFKASYKTWKDMHRDPIFWIRLAESYEQQLDLILCADAYTVALERTPDDVKLWFTLAKIYARMNLKVQASNAAGQAKNRGSHDMNVRPFLRKYGGPFWVYQLDMEEYSANKIQKFWKGRRCRKFMNLYKKKYINASIKAQKIARGYIARCRVRHMRNRSKYEGASKHLKRLMNQLKYKCFVSWNYQRLQNLRVKSFMRSTLGKTIEYTFFKWTELPDIVKREKKAAATTIQSLVR
jgi:tetratricopeptide (TPR) repeat protein